MTGNEAYSKMASQDNWWAKPLPPNWEAKYDANTQRHFYIDHTTHKTTWEDPRKEYYEKQKSSGTPLCTACGVKKVQVQGEQCWNCRITNEFQIDRTAGDESESDDGSLGLATVDQEMLQKLKEMFPSVGEPVIAAALEKNANVEGLAIMDLTVQGYTKSVDPKIVERNKAVRRLKALYPSADESLVKDILAGVNNDENKASEKLKKMFEPEPKPSSSNRASPARASPKRSELSQAVKTHLQEKMQQEFSTQAKTVIEMALDACQFDETKTRHLLESMSSPTREVSASSEASSRPLTGDVSLSEVTFSATTPKTSISSSTPGASTSTSNKSKSNKRATSPTKKTNTTKAKAKTKTANVHTHVIPKQKSPKKHATTGQYVSALRTHAAGPDGSLVQGHDKSNLLDTYVPQFGPQKAHRHGPDPNLHSGDNEHSASEGPDHKLYHGPDHSLYTGPNPELAKGPGHYNEV
ncbi:unnamed protein product [Owenia fusiformis]|uniref:Uncharacterized protein n=1 Tax=Owenia fusiformis TaxID=6347 RepID=A0A8J1UD30_OWEFU|nr:unnamed protein product [Owenia fusiformis]